MKHLNLLLFSLCGWLWVGSGKEAHVRLVQDLLDVTKYDRNVRPVLNFSTPVTVKMRMNLYQLLKVDEPQQNLKLYVWVTQYWTDEFLGWHSDEYDGIKTITLPYNKVWLPDTYLYNNLEMTRESTERWISVIYSTNTTLTPQQPKPRAEAVFQYPAIFQFSCKMDILYFPFDKQKCTMSFGSWTNDKAGIDYFPYRQNVTFESFVQNEEWNVQKFDWAREEITYNCCPVPYTLLYVHLTIQRKALYYVVNLVVPTSIITLIAVVGFFMPASTTGERTEKVNLGITTLLAMSILLLMVSDQMPTTSDFIPIIGWFFLSIICIISIGTCLTSLIIVLHQKGKSGKRVPCPVRAVFFGCIARMFCMSPPLQLTRQYQNIKLAKSKAKQQQNNNTDHEEETPLVHVFGGDVATKKANGYPSPTVGDYDLDRRPTPPFGASFPPDIGILQLDDIRRNIQQIKGMMEAREEGSVCEMEWQFLANILDRLFLIVFVSMVAIVTGGMLLAGALMNQDLDLLSN